MKYVLDSVVTRAQLGSSRFSHSRSPWERHTISRSSLSYFGGEDERAEVGWRQRDFLPASRGPPSGAAPPGANPLGADSDVRGDRFKYDCVRQVGPVSRGRHRGRHGPLSYAGLWAGLPSDRIQFFLLARSMVVGEAHIVGFVPHDHVHEKGTQHDGSRCSWKKKKHLISAENIVSTLEVFRMLNGCFLRRLSRQKISSEKTNKFREKCMMT